MALPDFVILNEVEESRSHEACGGQRQILRQAQNDGVGTQRNKDGARTEELLTPALISATVLDILDNL
jgi:hypothetical protein